MFRQPDTLLEACDRVARLCVKWVTRRASPQSPPLVFIPLHKGADSFMSDEQFRTFYWPSLRKVIQGLVDDGFVPYLFAEGAYNNRLEAITDVPAGRTVWHFDRTDMRRAKNCWADRLHPGQCPDLTPLGRYSRRRNDILPRSHVGGRSWWRLHPRCRGHGGSGPGRKHAGHVRSCEAVRKLLARHPRRAKEVVVSDQEFTKESLAEFDGKDGRPAYVACEGTVYDVTESLSWAAGSTTRSISPVST